MSYKFLIITSILIGVTILGDHLLQRLFRYLKPHWNETMRDILAWVVTVTIVVTAVFLLFKFGV